MSLIQKPLKIIKICIFVVTDCCSFFFSLQSFLYIIALSSYFWTLVIFVSEGVKSIFYLLPVKYMSPSFFQIILKKNWQVVVIKKFRKSEENGFSHILIISVPNKTKFSIITFLIYCSLRFLFTASHLLKIGLQ